MNKRITIRIYIYVKYMYTSTLYQRMVVQATGLGNNHCFHRIWALSGTVAQTCPRLVRCTKARIGGFSQNWRWGREPNVGAKVWKIAWEIKYHKGCVCVAWNCWRIFVVELWGVFLRKKDVEPWRLEWFLTKAWPFHINLGFGCVQNTVEDITQMIWDGNNEKARKSCNCQMLSWKVQPEGQVCGLRGRISPGPHSGPNVERCFPLKFLPPKIKKCFAKHHFLGLFCC